MAKILFPPRPKGAIPPTELEYFESQGGFGVQCKYNGARSIVRITPDGQVYIYSRHGRPHRTYTMSVSVMNEFLSLPGLKKGIEVWLDGELLSKTTATDTKNKIVLFDVLHYENYLFMKPDQKGRIELLSTICGNPTKLDAMRGMAYVVSENILMAPTFYSNFKEEFCKDRGDEVEGLVLRKLNSALDNFGQKEYEVDWLIRCRRPHKNYNF
jgi:ATP-dependent DNA ligase